MTRHAGGNPASYRRYTHSRCLLFYKLDIVYVPSALQSTRHHRRDLNHSIPLQHNTDPTLHIDTTRPQCPDILRHDTQPSPPEITAPHVQAGDNPGKYQKHPHPYTPSSWQQITSRSPSRKSPRPRRQLHVAAATSNFNTVRSMDRSTRQCTAPAKNDRTPRQPASRHYPNHPCSALRARYPPSLSTPPPRRSCAVSRPVPKCRHIATHAVHGDLGKRGSKKQQCTPTPTPSVYVLLYLAPP